MASSISVPLPNMLTKYVVILTFVVCMASTAVAQEDTVSLKAMYDHALDYKEADADSADLVATILEERSSGIPWQVGIILAHRLRGIADDLRNDYAKAIPHYLTCLDLSRRLGLKKYEAASLSDLGYDHYLIGDFKKSKDYYLTAAVIGSNSGSLETVISDYSNLGSAYNTLGMTDSALFYFDLAMDSAHKIQKNQGLSALRNNIGNSWFRKGEYSKAMGYFRFNLEENERNADQDQLWYDVINLSEVFIEMSQLDSARIYLARSMALAKSLRSKRKEAEVEKLYSKYYSRSGDYRNAYEALNRWQNLDSVIVNAETRSKILDLEQKYLLRKKDDHARSLMNEIEQNKYVKGLFILALLLLISVIMALIFFYFKLHKQKIKLEEKNDFMLALNQRYSFLDTEKNSLVRVISHDLNAPLAVIKTWLEIMKPDNENLTEVQRRSMDRIERSVENGEALIRKILSIERAEPFDHDLKLESFALDILLQDLLIDFQKLASHKQVNIKFKYPGKSVAIISDKFIVSRVVSNLLTNAIKYTPKGKSVHLDLGDGTSEVTILVRDEGMGIPNEEIGDLFNRYAKFSNMPTDGEESTGLGLYIVKRLLDEIGGRIVCQSEVGVGTIFKVYLKK